MSQAAENAMSHAKDLVEKTLNDDVRASRTIGQYTFNAEYIGNAVVEWWVEDEDGDWVHHGLTLARAASTELALAIAEHAYGLEKPLTTADIDRITTSDELDAWL